MIEAAPENERILRVMRPCRMALAGMFAIWLYLGALGAFWIIYEPPVVERLNLARAREWGMYLGMWGIGILLPAAVLWQAQVRFLYFLGAAAIVAAAGGLRYWQPDHPFGLENLLLIGVGAAGLVLTELFRRGHRYSITTGRLAIAVDFCTHHQRQLLFSKINDVVVHRGILGRLFGFGNVIPITASGLGTGSEWSFFGGGMAGRAPFLSQIAVAAFLGGGRSVTVAGGRSDLIFFGIADPDAVAETVFELMKTREAVYRASAAEALEPHSRGGRGG